MQATMQAVRIHRFGGAQELTLEEAPVPDPGPTEVLVRVRAAGVNPVDWKVREGYLEELMPHRLPLILGWDAAGEVAAVGEQVPRFRHGDEVYAQLDVRRNGAYAQYAVVDVIGVSAKPASIGMAAAAATPIAAATAYQGLFEVAGLEKGQRVLIHAGAGGVGSFAVQLAKWKGATVLATASERNAEFVRGLGADEVIDYEKQRFEEVAKNVDVVFDSLGHDTQGRSWSTLKPGGFLVSIVTPVAEDAMARAGARGAYFFARQDADTLAAIAALIDEGAVRTIVSEELPLAEARRAHEQSESRRTRGKIVLIVP